MLIGLLLLVGGIALVVWGAERFTDGAMGVAVRFGLSTFYVGVLVSGFEPENLVTGGAAALSDLPQIALGTVVGSAVFLLTAGLGVTLLVIPMEVRIPRAGGLAMIASVLAFSLTLWNDGTVTRREGLMLVAVALGLMAWLYRATPVLMHARAEEAGDHHGREMDASRVKVFSLLLLGVGVMLAGAELVVHGARTLLASVPTVGNLSRGWRSWAWARAWRRPPAWCRPLVADIPNSPGATSSARPSCSSRSTSASWPSCVP